MPLKKGGENLHNLDAIITLRDNFSGTLQTIDENVKNFQKTTRNAARDARQTGKKLSDLGGTLTKSITLPVVGAGIAIAKTGKEFNEGLSNIATLIPGQSERLQELKKDIQEVAIATGKSTNDITEGTYSVISAYGDAEDTMEKVEINAKAARAGLATTNDALNLSSAVMKGFGDTSAEANEKVMDLAFETLKLGQTSFPDLAASIGAVVPLTNELGIAQEELFGIYATATGVTGNASEVSTQYRGILKALMAPTKDMTALMQKMGYADGQAMIKKEGLLGTIKAIVNAAESSGTPLQKYIGSIRGQTLALALAGEQSDVYQEKLEKLKNSTGAMDTAFKEQTEGINETGFTYEQAMVKMQVAAQEFSDAIAPLLAKGADLISNFADAMKNLTPEQKEFISKLAITAAKIGPVVLGIGRLTKGVSSVMFTFSDFAKKTKKMGSVMKALLSPGNKVALAITGIALAAYLVYKNWDKISAFFKGIGESVTNTFDWVKDTITSSIETVNDITTNAKDTMLGTWKSFTTSISNIIETCKTTVVDTFTNIKTTIVGIWNNIVNTVSNVIGNFVEFITTKFSVQIFLFGTILNNIKNIFKNVWEAIKTIVGGIAIVVWDLVTGNFEQLQKDVAGIFGRLKVIFGNIWQNIKDIFVSYLWIIGFTMQDIWNGIVTAAQTIWDTFKGYMANLWQTIKTIAITSWISLKTSVIDLCASTKQWIIDIWNSVIAWFTTLPERLYTAGVNMFASFKNGIISMRNSVVASAKNAGKSVIDAIKNLPKRALEIGKNIMTSLGQGIKNSVLNPIQSIKNAGDSAIQALRDKLGIASPSKVMLEMGKFTTEGFAQGIEANTGMIEKPTNDMITRVERPVTRNVSNITNSPQSSKNNINIDIHMNGITIREESDIDKIATAIVNKMKKAEVAYGGA